MKRIFAGIAMLLLLFALLYSNTGFLQAKAIDNKDIQAWQFENGVIVGAEGYTLQGNSGECWVMVHGYTSTPDELRIVAHAVNEAFNDTVYVPRLDGHGMLPSDITRFSVAHWYNQVEDIAKRNSCDYLLGSSMGSLIALRYAEKHGVTGVVAVGAPFALEPHYLPTGKLTGAFSSVVSYTKRDELGETIDNRAARKEHISGYRFPLGPIEELYDFSLEVKQELPKIIAPVLFLHGNNDKVAYIGGAREAQSKITSGTRFVELNGNHVVFRDFGKEQAVAEVLNFRKTM